MSESTDMVTEVYGHILDEDRRKNAELMENAFYNKENLNPQMKNQDERQQYDYCTGWSGCGAADEGTGKSEDGCVTNIIGKDNKSIILGRKTILYRWESLCSIVF